MEKILIMMAEYFDLTIRNKIHEKKLIKMCKFLKINPIHYFSVKHCCCNINCNTKILMTGHSGFNLISDCYIVRHKEWYAYKSHLK